MSLKMKKKGITIANVLLAGLMCTTTVLGHFAMDVSDLRLGSATEGKVTEKSVSFEEVTGQVNFSNVKLRNLSNQVMANEEGCVYDEQAVIVSLGGETLSDRANGLPIAEYLSTQTGRAHQAQIKAEQERFLQALKASNIKYSLITDYNTVLNGVAIKVNTAHVATMKQMANVNSVVISKTYNAPKTVTETDTSAITNETSVHETGIYDSGAYADEFGGKGMAVAVLDTGLDYTHEAFQLAPDASTLKYTEADVASIMNTARENGDPFSAQGNVFVSNKVPFAYDYADRDADVYPSYSNHGTHVAGIIGGNADSYTDKDGNIAKDENGKNIPFVSAAPHTQLVICKVFTDDLDSKTVGGAETVDILDALDDCVKLGVDVINMSLGTTCGFSGTDDGDLEGLLMENTYNSIKANGISLICAASNDYSSAYGGVFGTNLTSNPDSGTVGSPSTFSSALSVASISGKKSPYILANGNYPVFYRESSDENNVDYDFAELMLGGEQTKTYKYVVIGGVGLSSNYQSSVVKKAISDAHKAGEKIIALVKRGNNTFQEKVENAQQAGADAIIIYNNVAGEIKMTIGDVEDPIPAISITYEAGEQMRKNAKSSVGEVTLNPKDFNAGPFMSDFSSWGVTSDLKLKPEITAHGGEITSSVPGGWAEQSGTSMATPNVAGLVANIRSYVTQNYSKFFTGTPDAKKITQLTNQLMMSTAVIVRDQKNLPYSPRKQGAGLASLDNIIQTNAYLFTDENETIESAHGAYKGAVDNRAKLEIGEDENKVGEYTLRFYVNNVGGAEKSFKLNSLMMTETVSLDGLTVGEQAYMLDDEQAVWTIGGQTYHNGDTVVFPAESNLAISVTLKLSANEKKYIDKNFKNGMYVEGFAQLLSTDTENQCNLSLPFMGFYGDWESAPMLDYDAFEISKFEQDTSILEDEKPKASVWATQAYAVYWNDQFVLPMGSFVYKQSEDDEVRKIYTTEEYSSISCYNDYQGDDANNYMTSTAIKGLYAGLLRNARQVDCRMYNVATGELMYTKEVYRVNKAYTNAGSTTPGFVRLEMSPEELGLVENGQYRMEFDFHYHTPEEGDVVKEEDTFQFSFYIDYTSPVLKSASIRYFDYKDGNKEKQKVYLDMEVFDNHYAMAALLCYMDTTNPENPELQLCTEYVTPIYDAKKNGVSTVSIEITDIYEKYGDNLYVELDDYALNHSVYQIKIEDAQKNVLPSTFNLATGEDNITLGKYETHKVALTWDKAQYPNANISNFTWSVSGSSAQIVAVKNGEIVGLSAGTGTVTVSNGKTTKAITVTVTDNDKQLNYPSLSFDVILNGVKAPVKAQGTIDVNVAQKIRLEVVTNPWYYTHVRNLDLVWTSTNSSVATVDQNGNVVFYKKGRASINATIQGTLYSATVAFNVEEPFKVSSYTLTGYEGAGGVVHIPTDMNIMSIGEGAFKENTDITAVIIPKTVTTIDVRAFYGCTNLKHVFFIDVETQEIAESALTLINREAFAGCTALEYLDFSNCKTFTVARSAFYNCTSLKLIKGVENAGTAYDSAFENCTSLVGSLSADSGIALVNGAKTERDDKERITAYEIIPFNTLKGNITALDVSGLHVSGVGVFRNCQSLIGVKTGKFSAIGTQMFYGCKNIRDLVVEAVKEIGANAFASCTRLRTVTLKDVDGMIVGNGAFRNCGNLITVAYDNATVAEIGDYAFENTYLNAFTLPDGIERIGSEILSGTEVTSVDFKAETLANVIFNGASFRGIAITVDGLTPSEDLTYNANFTKLLYVKPTATSVTILPSTTTIGAYAFAYSNVKSVFIPASVQTIEQGAFANSALEQITFAEDSLLKRIESSAFSATKLTEITLPKSVTTVGDGVFEQSTIATFAIEGGGDAPVVFGDGVFADCSKLVSIDLSESNITEMGDYTFANAQSLAVVALPALQKLGNYTFFGAMEMTSLTFAEGAKTTGTGTFYTYQLNYATMSLQLVPYTKLTSVTLGGATQAIGESAFMACTALESIDLRLATTVEPYAFYGCEKLSTVTGLNRVGKIGAYAFYNCKGLRVLNLENATVIDLGAFRIDRATGENTVAYNQINIPKATYVGAFAFYGNSATTVHLPATLSGMLEKDVYSIEGKEGGLSYRTVIGAGAFAGAKNLTSFTVAEENGTYFAEDGVLYRRTDRGEYELVAFPARYGSNDYAIKNGTTRVEAYAFAGANVLTGIILPYSVKSIGSGAFYDSTVNDYNFKGYVAPALEAEYDAGLLELVRPDISYRGLFNNNFGEYLMNYVGDINLDAIISTLKITVPTNGKGYDSYLYEKYFTTYRDGGYVLNDEARTVKNNIESMPYTLEEVKGWATNAFAVNEGNKQTVLALSDLIKTTHRLYNNVANDRNQCELITQENLDAFFAMEEALRAVKAKFNIAVKISGTAFGGDYKATYVQGETFDLSGLVITFTYDDYSTQSFTGDDITLTTAYERPLTTLDRLVKVNCMGKTVLVDVSVVEEVEEEAEEPDVQPKPSETPIGLIIGLSVGGAVLLAGGAVAVLLILKKKKGAKKEGEPSEGNGDEN